MLRAKMLTLYLRGRMAMKNPARVLFCGAVVILAMASGAMAQKAPIQPPTIKPSANPAPAAQHDIGGVWVGPLLPWLYDVPPMTPWAEEQYKKNRSNGTYAVLTANDPLSKCDPMGFPRNVLYQDRGIQFAETPTKMLELWQYQKVWREIWKDGRGLAKNVGADSPDAPESRYYGYSVGHWDGGYTFVIETNGTDDRTWLDNEAHPHSADLTAEERYTRVNHDSLTMEIRIDDPKAYTKPWLAAKADFVWLPKQQFEEQLCIPSDAAEYFSIIASPAGETGKKGAR
jgi:hypothetical protein